MNSRRLFLASVVIGSASLGLDASAQTQVDEKDAQAVALGYRADASRVDAKKYPKYQPGQACGKCAFYQGSAGDSTGACPLLGGNKVNAAGWCNTWVKKP